MTVGVAIKCPQGIVLACDSLSTFGRGVAVSKYVEKSFVIERDELAYPVAVVGAGMTAFIDKFSDRLHRGGIQSAAQRFGRKLDIIDFAEGVCENLVTILYKEYELDRSKFLEVPFVHFNLMLIIAGRTRDGDLRSFIVHADGITENIPHYGTIGSGSAYAELFLRDLGFTNEVLTLTDAAGLAVYAVQGAAIMDPNVGGKVNVLLLKPDKSGIMIEPFDGADQLGRSAKQEIYELLKDMGQRMRGIVRSDSTLKKLMKPF